MLFLKKVRISSEIDWYHYQSGAYMQAIRAQKIRKLGKRHRTLFLNGGNNRGGREHILTGRGGHHTHFVDGGTTLKESN